MPIRTLLVLLFCAALCGPAAAQSPVVVYVPAYGPLYSGPLVDVRGAWLGRNLQPTFGMRRVPIAGLNSPPVRPGVRLAGVRRAPAPAPPPAAPVPEAGKEGDDFYLEPLPEVDPARVQLIRSFESVMEKRPIVQGTVERVGATGVLVRYERDGELVTGRFEHGSVYFFRDEQLESGITRPEHLQVGTPVLVPLPSPPAAVAGVREERRIVPRRATPVSSRRTPPRKAAPAASSRRPAK